MFELTKIRLANWGVRQLERKGQGEGIVFVSANKEIREVGEAMLIDGFLPSEINQVTIDMMQQDARNTTVQDRLGAEYRLREIRESLLIETSDETVINHVVKESEREMCHKSELPLLLPSNPVREVDIATYQ